MALAAADYQHAQTEKFSGYREVQTHLLSVAAERLQAHANTTVSENADRLQKEGNDILPRLAQLATPMGMFEAWMDYAIDAGQRTILMMDALRRRGDIFLNHEAAGAPPVLVYDYEVVMDGATLPRPSNYMLLRILPRKGQQVHDWKRPYVIIDPRAGHGPGIGGFKEDSQVGVALANGHPVYFVAFHPEPQPGQVLADVTHSEAAFIREVRRRHPKAAKPVVVGNCQGGWATAILAATNPDLTGPIVLNGAPMSYWAGRLGQDPMRYIGGAVGGALPAVLMSDLAGGIFDGANLVLNFEMLNPGRTWFRKYYDLYGDIDGGVERFLEFEKWWGGYYLMTAEEIRWIVENLFVGNRLGKNEARLETGRPIDLKTIRAPIIVFASHGDNITPPQQALNWIVDTYADEMEIQIRGQRIIYMVHEEVGHLGIFVSSSIARREHDQMASTLKTIEALAPGLYEMVIEDVTGEGHAKSFKVAFQKRKMEDILALGDGRGEEAAFAAVARMSEIATECYELTARPWVQAFATIAGGDKLRPLHPMRAQRSIFASSTPGMLGVNVMAERIRGVRRPVPADNPFLLAEKLTADLIETSLNTVRDMRAAALEMAFLGAYAHPFAMWFGEPNAARRSRKSKDELRALPEVQHAIDSIDRGGLAEAIIRMMVLLADTRSNVRRDRLERSADVLINRPPFLGMDSALRARMIHEQTLICHFEPADALDRLPSLLPAIEDRRAAVAMVEYVVGDVADMEPDTYARLNRFRALFDLPKIGEAIEPAAADLPPATPDAVPDFIGDEPAPPAPDAPVRRRSRTAGLKADQPADTLRADPAPAAAKVDGGAPDTTAGEPAQTPRRQAPRKPRAARKTRNEEAAE